MSATQADAPPRWLCELDAVIATAAEQRIADLCAETTAMDRAKEQLGKAVLVAVGAGFVGVGVGEALQNDMIVRWNRAAWHDLTLVCDEFPVEFRPPPEARLNRLRYVVTLGADIEGERVVTGGRWECMAWNGGWCSYANLSAALLAARERYAYLSLLSGESATEGVTPC